MQLSEICVKMWVRNAFTSTQSEENNHEEDETMRRGEQVIATQLFCWDSSENLTIVLTHITISYSFICTIYKLFHSFFKPKFFKSFYFSLFRCAHLRCDHIYSLISHRVLCGKPILLFDITSLMSMIWTRIVIYHLIFLFQRNATYYLTC